MILAGDIGGTKTVLAVFECGGRELRSIAEASYASASHDALEEILVDFLETHCQVDLDAACLGVAGPVIDGKANITNLPWQIDEAKLEKITGARRVVLLNDLEATAYGMLRLKGGDRIVLNAGRNVRPGHIAVLAAGTGLGEALLVWDGERHRAVASEGGHVSFAPRSDEQIQLLQFLRGELGGRVSTERILSGPGLHSIYRFMRQSSREAEPPWISERMSREDPSAVIAELALQAEEPICARSLELFVSIYGAEAGDLALQYMSAGGVFLGGGIAPKILPALQSDTFLEAFTDKGRYRDFVAGLEVIVALEPRTALLGAAQHAAGL